MSIAVNPLCFHAENIFTLMARLLENIVYDVTLLDSEMFSSIHVQFDLRSSRINSRTFSCIRFGITDRLGLKTVEKSIKLSLISQSSTKTLRIKGQR